MNPLDASAAMRAASADLEALRPEALRAEISKDDDDEPIRMAWRLAQNRFRRACKAYTEAP